MTDISYTQGPKCQSVDVTIAELAERQHGVVARRHLLERGVGERAIRHRVANRRLKTVHAGVYSVGAQPLGVLGWYIAAVLACGSEAVVSHDCAAALHDLRLSPAGAVDITVPSGRRRGGDGIALHSSRSLLSRDVSRIDGVPCTSLARTLLDLAGDVPPHVLDRMLDKAITIGTFDLGALNDVLSRASGRSTRQLRRALATLTDTPSFERQELEHRFARLVRRAGLPPPVVNATVAGYVVDFHWPAARLVVETDSRAHHTSNKAFEQDRQRDLDLQLAGWKTVRVTWRQLNERPETVAALLRTYLDG